MVSKCTCLCIGIVKGKYIAMIFKIIDTNEAKYEVA